MKYAELKTGNEIIFKGRKGVLLSDAVYKATTSKGWYEAKVQWEDGQKETFMLNRIGLSIWKKETKEIKMKKGKTEVTLPKGRTAYFLLESQTNDNGEFRALIAVENEDGYYKTDWFWGKDLAVAEKIAQEKNEMMGISRDEAFKIVGSTMRKGAVEKPRF